VNTKQAWLLEKGAGRADDGHLLALQLLDHVLVDRGLHVRDEHAALAEVAHLPRGVRHAHLEHDVRAKRALRVDDLCARALILGVLRGSRSTFLRVRGGPGKYAEW
jgi:hypothetical protein